MNAERIAELRADAGNRFVSRMGRVCLEPAEALELFDLVKAQQVALEAADEILDYVEHDPRACDNPIPSRFAGATRCGCGAIEAYIAYEERRAKTR